MHTFAIISAKHSLIGNRLGGKSVNQRGDPMRRYRVFGPAVVAVWLIYCPVAASGTKLAPVQEPLPEIFGTLDWKMSAEDIKARFPSGKIRNDIPGWDGKDAITATMVWNVTWSPLGDAVINFARDKRDRIRWISIESTELNYTACEPGPRTTH